MNLQVFSMQRRKMLYKYLYKECLYDKKTICMGDFIKCVHILQTFHKHLYFNSSIGLIYLVTSFLIDQIALRTQRGLVSLKIHKNTKMMLSCH